jgi:hypothetical protein
LLKQEKGQQFELREATEEIARLIDVRDDLSAQLVLSKSTQGKTAAAGPAGDAWVRDDKSAVTIKDMQKRLDEANAALKSRVDERDALQQRCVALEMEQRKVKMQQDFSERMGRILRGEFQESQKEVELLSQSIARLQQQYDEMQAAYAHALGEAAASNMELKTRDAEMGRKVRRMMNELGLQKETAMQAENALQSANQRLFDTSDTIENLRGQIVEMKKEVADAREQLRLSQISSQTQIAEMEKEVADAREQLRLSQTQVAEMKKEVASASPPPPPWEGGSLQFLRAYGGLFPPPPAPPAPLSQSSLLTTGTLAAPFPGTAPPQQHPSVYPPTGTPLPPSTYNCYRPGG